MIVCPSRVVDLIWNSVRLNRCPCNHHDLSIWFSLQSNRGHMLLGSDMVYVRKQHHCVTYQHLRWKKKSKRKTKRRSTKAHIDFISFFVISFATGDDATIDSSSIPKCLSFNFPLRLVHYMLYVMCDSIWNGKCVKNPSEKLKIDLKCYFKLSDSVFVVVVRVL